MNNRKLYLKMQNKKHDWIRYILYTGADEHGNLPVQTRLTGSPLRQGGFACATAPAAAVSAQGAGIQPACFNFAPSGPTSLETHPRACWTNGKKRQHPHQPQLQGRSGSYPVLRAISKQQSTTNSSRQRRASRRHSVSK